MPDLTGTLKRVLDRLEKEPVTITITDQRSKKPVDVKVGKIGLQFLIMRDLGDASDLPIFPLWFYTMDKGDYSVLKRFVERRLQPVRRRTLCDDARDRHLIRCEQSAKTADSKRSANRFAR